MTVGSQQLRQFGLTHVSAQYRKSHMFPPFFF
jgi:hypothetical protein